MTQPAPREVSYIPKFPQTYCSQCGGSFGAGDSGYSHCVDHGSNRVRNRVCQMIEAMQRIVNEHPACKDSRNDADTPDELLDAAALLNDVAKIVETFAVGLMDEAAVKGDFVGYITEAIDDNLTAELRMKAQDKLNEAAFEAGPAGRKWARINHQIKIAAE